MYTLYYSPGACSRACHIVLEELKVPYQRTFVNLKAGEQRKPEFLALNPGGQVPVLIDGDLTLTEGAAILQYLCDKHDAEALLPRSQPLRANTLKWLMFMNATLHPAHGLVFGAGRYFDGGDQQATLKAKASERAQNLWNIVESSLAQRKFLAGDQMTIADILMTVIAGWGGSTTPPIQFGPNTQRVINAVQALPSFQKVKTTEDQASAKAA